MHIEGRKSEHTLPDGTVVSRQRIWQMRHRDQYNAYKREYNRRPKAKRKAKEVYRAWNEKYEQEHGETYSAWYYREVMKRRVANANQEPTTSQTTD